MTEKDKHHSLDESSSDRLIISYSRRELEVMIGDIVVKTSLASKVANYIDSCSFYI